MNKENIEKSENAAGAPLEIIPLVDIIEHDDKTVLFFEVPGANAASVSITVENSILAIDAKSSLVKNDRQIVFKRKFQLSNSADVEKITAKTLDGVLTLTIPKSEKIKVHKIKVN